MSQARHTPGPWRTAKQGKSYLRISATQWDGLAKVVTKMQGASTFTTEGLSNAKLIAAAPELLGALKSMVLWTEKHNLNLADLIDGNKAEVPVVTIARAAIAKAEGAHNVDL